MDGDLFGMASPAAATTTNNITAGGYSDEPSLLDFASPPPSQDTNGFDLMQQEQQQHQPKEPSQPQQQQPASDNLLDFGATPSQPQNQEPDVDLFGGGFSSNPTPNTTPQPQSTAQPVDFFGSPMPEVSDVVAPSPAPAAATDDPFGVFMQSSSPQPNTIDSSDPFSAFSGNLAMPPQPVAKAIPEIDDEEKKDQESPMVTLKPAKQKDENVTVESKASATAYQTTTIIEETEASIPNNDKKISTDEEQPQQQPQPPNNSSEFLSTMTKLPKVTESKASAVANRFAGFKSMAGNIAAKGAERVAKVKDQMQKEEGDGQTTTSGNRFAGFKNLAGNMAAKGAERVAKVKDQIQKEDGDGHNTTTKQRFAGFKNMAENMAAKGAEQVAKVKDQIQKEDANGQNINAKRLAGFKNMAGNIAARGAKSVANVQVPQQLASVQVTQRFKEAKLPMFGKGIKMMESIKGNSSHGMKAAASSSSSQVSASSSVPLPECIPGTDAKPPLSPGSSPSKPTATSTDAIPKNTVATTEPTSTAGKSTEKMEFSVTEPKSTENKAESSLASQEQDDSLLLTESVSNENIAVESAAQKTSDDKVEGGETKTTISESIPSVPQHSAPVVSEESQKSSPAKPNSSEKAETKPEPLLSDTTVSETDTKASLSKSAALDPASAKENSTDSISPESTKDKKPQGRTSQQKEASVPSKEMSGKLESLQEELNAAKTLIQQLQKQKDVKDKKDAAVMAELQENLQKELTRRAEAEDKARVAIAKSKQVEEEYNTFRTESKSNLDVMTTNLESVTKQKDALEKEMVDIREERDEQARKEMALTTRLNDAKKKEAVKANAAEHYGDQVDQLELAVKDYESQVETLTAERDQLRVELGEWKEYAEKRTKQLETALNDEKKLNDERKQKMKGFIEAKTEEVRAAKADYISLQTELDQTSHSLTELNQRYKQLHAQWVQSQTRNRELQRDAMKMKKDSEKMHKVGGSLEARLSRSAQQSEDHKNKRIHARNELMSVLGQLEAERSVNTRLQESIKMTFTPKALSQQQTIQEALDDFEAALQKLSLRIGRPLPPTFSNDPNVFADNVDMGVSSDMNEGISSETADDSSKQGTVTLSEISSNKAVQKLENETQRVSQNIVKFSANIERMHNLLDGGGAKSCVDVLSQILMAGNTPAITAGATPTRKSSGQRYGQISRNVP